MEGWGGRRLRTSCVHRISPTHSRLDTPTLLFNTQAANIFTKEEYSTSTYPSISLITCKTLQIWQDLYPSGLLLSFPSSLLYSIFSDWGFFPASLDQQERWRGKKKSKRRSWPKFSRWPWKSWWRGCTRRWGQHTQRLQLSGNDGLLDIVYIIYISWKYVQ